MTFVKSIGWAVLAVAAVSVLGKAFAGVREILIANYFGVGATTDCYVIGSSVPGRIGLMFGMMAYTAFIPVFGKYAVADREGAYRLFNACFVIVSSALILLTLAVIVRSGALIRVLAPGMSAASQALSARLQDVMACALAIVGVSSLLRALNSIHGRYLMSALYEPSANLLCLAVMVVLVPHVGIFGLAIGLVAGAAGQLAIQAVGLRNLPGARTFRVDFSHPGVREFLIAFVPLIATVAIVEVNYFIMRSMASLLPSGAISALNFSFTVTYFPLGILDLVIVTMLFPLIAGLVNQGRLVEVGEIMNDLVRVIIFTLLPLSVFMIVFRHPVIELLFQRGAFDAEATRATSLALGFFAIGLFAWGLDYLLFRAYYVLKEMGLYMKMLIFRVVLNVLLNFILMRFFAQGGIALAFSLALIAYLVPSFFILKRILVSLNVRRIREFFLISASMSLIMGIVLVLADRTMGPCCVWRNSVPGQFSYLAICAAIGLIIYLLCAVIAVPGELALFRDLLRLKKTKLASLAATGPEYD